MKFVSTYFIYAQIVQQSFKVLSFKNQIFHVWPENLMEKQIHDFILFQSQMSLFFIMFDRPCCDVPFSYLQQF